MPSQKRSRDNLFANKKEDDDERQMRRLHEARVRAAAAKKIVMLWHTIMQIQL